MNQTSTFNRRFRLEFTHGLKSFCMTLSCVLLMLVFGVANSMGQTMSQTSEIASAHVITLIQEETNALELEMKDPNGTAETDYNDLLIGNYQSVINKWHGGADLKDVLKDVDYILQHTNQDSAEELHPNGQVNLLTGTDRFQLNMLVDELDLEDGDDSDLEAVFTFWRTVKNR